MLARGRISGERGEALAQLLGRRQHPGEEQEGKSTSESRRPRAGQRERLTKNPRRRKKTSGGGVRPAAQPLVASHHPRSRPQIDLLPPQRQLLAQRGTPGATRRGALVVAAANSRPRRKRQWPHRNQAHARNRACRPPRPPLASQGARGQKGGAGKWQPEPERQDLQRLFLPQLRYPNGRRRPRRGRE